MVPRHDKNLGIAMYGYPYDYAIVRSSNQNLEKTVPCEQKYFWKDHIVQVVLLRQNVNTHNRS